MPRSHCRVYTYYISTWDTVRGSSWSGRMRSFKFAVVLLTANFLVPPAEASQCKAPPLRQGMSYPQARQIIIRHGFMAHTPPAYGYGKNDQKVISECSGSVKTCDEFPEIDSCSGQGYCRMEFQDVYQHKLVVMTYGDIVTYTEKGQWVPRITEFQISCQ